MQGRLDLSLRRRTSRLKHLALEMRKLLGKWCATLEVALVFRTVQPNARSGVTARGPKDYVTGFL